MRHNYISKIKAELKRGAFWVLSSNVVIYPTQYLNAILLGRLSPEALGIYQIFRFLARIVPFLTMLGGEKVMMTLLPKLEGKEKSHQFVESYFILSLCTCVLIVFVSLIFKPQFYRLFKSDFDAFQLNLIFSLIILISLKEFTGITLFAQRKYMEAVLTRRIPLVGITVVIAVYYLANYQYFLRNYTTVILQAYLAVAAISSIIGIWFTWKTLFKLPKQFFLPKTFWKMVFVLFTIGGLSLLKADIDRYFVWLRLNLKDLGYYAACVTIFLALRYFPQSMGSVFLVNFSSMIGTSKYEELSKIYALAFKKLNLFVSVGSLFISSYSHYILWIYGKSYRAYDSILMLLSLRAVIIVPSLLNSPLVLSGEKVIFRAIYDVVELTVNILLIFLFAHLYGLLGVAIARVLCGVIMESLSIFYVRRTFGISLPSEFFLFLILQILNCSLTYLLPRSIFISTSIFILCMTFLMSAKIIPIDGSLTKVSLVASSYIKKWRK